MFCFLIMDSQEVFYIILANHCNSILNIKAMHVWHYYAVSKGCINEPNAEFWQLIALHRTVYVLNGGLTISCAVIYDVG